MTNEKAVRHFSNAALGTNVSSALWFTVSFLSPFSTCTLLSTKLRQAPQLDGSKLNVFPRKELNTSK